MTERSDGSANQYSYEWSVKRPSRECVGVYFLWWELSEKSAGSFSLKEGRYCQLSEKSFFLLNRTKAVPCLYQVFTGEELPAFQFSPYITVAKQGWKVQSA